MSKEMRILAVSASYWPDQMEGILGLSDQDKEQVSRVNAIIGRDA
jgi:hypothetical protein